jgi:hypothetical protein
MVTASSMQLVEKGCDTRRRDKHILYGAKSGRIVPMQLGEELVGILVDVSRIRAGKLELRLERIVGWVRFPTIVPGDLRKRRRRQQTMTCCQP